MSLAALPLCIVLAAVQPPAGGGSPSTEFLRGKIAFQRAEYARAIDVLRPLLYPEPRLESESEMAESHRMLGVAHLFLRQNEQSAQEFRRFLQLRPDYRMDPLLDPPVVVDFFNAVLKEQEGELAELERKRREATQAEQRRLEQLRSGPVVVERRYVRNSLAVAFLPFGAGQFQNNQSGKGWFFFATESLLAGTSVAAFTLNFAIYGARPALQCMPGASSVSGSNGCPADQEPTRDRERSQSIMKVQLVTGALFFATAIWGVTDALLNFEPLVTEDGRPVPPRTANGGGDSDGAGRKAKSRTKGYLAGVRLAPALMPGALAGVGGGLAGGSLAFRF